MAKKKKYGRKIEYRSTKNKWVAAEFLKSLENGNILIKLEGGEVLSRSRKRVRFYLSKVVHKTGMEDSSKFRLPKTRKNKKRSKRRNGRNNFISRRPELTSYMKTLVKVDLLRWKKRTDKERL